ncbi:MAG: hypothetical protein C5B54_08995 [Acidobacteria bacterium]|nr:MAG: hypothetical protein C5B54_08995 [Acidobacteriota bacterium]
MNPSSIPIAMLNQPYNATFSASGGVGGFTFGQTGTLPTGLNFSVDTISGTATELGDFPITVTATDTNACKGHRDYALQVKTCIFCDDFGDLDFTNPLWTVAKGGTASAATGDLVLTTTKKIKVFSPNFGACTNCTFEAHLSINTPGGRFLLFGWFASPSDSVMAKFMPDKGKIVLKQRHAGLTAKARILTALNIGQTYDVKIVFNGSAFQFFLDGNLETTLNAIGTPSGNASVQAQSTTGGAITDTFEDLEVY